jgi:UDP-N-acetylmuramoyl-L-alanyl-D-glutamate--2,6-diaminopimelate ligase
MLGVLTGKAIYKLEKALHFGGTTMPGRVVLKFFPKTMKSLKYPENVIMVTGSCGKGSTTKLITEVLERAGMKVCCNRDGANQWEGVATTIMNQTKGDTVQADALVLEVDERYLKLVIRFLRPKYLVINNITRDQPPRQGDYDIV